MGRKTKKIIQIKEIKTSNIIEDKKQLSVRIPSNMALEFSINSKKDGFVWTVEETEGELLLR